MTDELDPQDPQPGESSRAWSAYVAYRELAPRERSLRAAYRRLSGVADARKAPGQWYTWSRLHGWVGRARAWDREQERRQRAELWEGRRERLKRRLLQAQALQGPALRALQAMAKSQELPRMSPRTLGELLKIAADLEDSAWGGLHELQESTVETLPQDGLDVLDSLKARRDVAPLLVHMQGLGVDLEPAGLTDTDDITEDAS